MTMEKVSNKTISLELRTEAISFWRLWCTACASLVNMATIESAATITGLSAELLIERLNRRGLHSLKKQSGNLLICLESLSQQFKPIREISINVSKMNIKSPHHSGTSEDSLGVLSSDSTKQFDTNSCKGIK